jgi:hypothetical protein
MWAVLSVLELLWLYQYFSMLWIVQNFVGFVDDWGLRLFLADNE